MKIRKIVLLAAVAFLALLRTSEGELSQTAAVRTSVEYNLPPTADAGRDFITYVGLPTQFPGYGTAPDDEIVKYEWDFDGDGAYDFQSMTTGLTSHVYHSTGTYSAVLRVHDAQGNVAIDTVQVMVRAGTGKQEYLPPIRVGTMQVPSIETQGDGLVERYAVMINGASETRFWNDVTFMYSTLADDHDFPPEHIHLFNHDGANPEGINPDDMIDYPATLSNIDAVFTDLSATIDGDDELFVWVTDHGKGYHGPQLRSYGYLNGFASVDPGDEQDYRESDFKLRSLCTYGDYGYPYYNHGMNVFKVYRRYSSSQGAYSMYRNKFVSTFADVYFESSGIQSDDDVYIERLIDYLLGDTDRDGYVETAQGEVFDYDGDGDPPYDHATGTFDEDDWGDLDYYEDNFNNINSGHPGDSYIIFDYNLDNRVDIDINYDPNHLEVDGTDLDNQGLFDGIDVNEDGDMDDWVSIDETIVLWADELYDDEMAIFLDRIDANVISIFMEPCFSGGFIDDLSAPDRVISTATEEETLSYGNLFVELFTSAFHRATRYGSTVDADYDHNGHISMQEAFNYAAENDYYSEVPQFDDNDDGIGHPYPIPQGGDGDLGAVTYLESFYGVMVSPITDARSGDPGQAITYTLHVTNGGTFTDTFAVTVSGYTWPTGAPSTVGPLAAGERATIDIVVHIPTSATAGETDTAAVAIASQGGGTQSATATLTTTANIMYGVMVRPATDAQSGGPGEAVTYTLQVTNTGTFTDTFDVSVSGYAWPTNAPSTVGPLAAGDSANVDATVSIPTSAEDGVTDTATVIVTSQGDSAQSATATLTTTAGIIYGVMMEPVTDAQSGGPGEAVTYTLQVTNSGNVTDTFDVTVSDHTWPITTPTTIGPLAAGDSASVVATVSIPTSAEDGVTDTATVIVTSQGDNTQSATTTLTTTANIIYGVMVEPVTDAQSGGSGEAVTYTLQVTNAGNITDTFGVSVSGYTWPITTPTTVGPLAAGDSTNVDVIVHIPTSATGGETDVAAITLTSQGDHAQSATATLTTTANIIYGVMVRPATDAQSGDPGEAVTYTLQVTNTGNVTDTFEVTVSDYTWPTTAPVVVGPLEAGASASLDVTVNIPTDAAGDATDTVSVSIASQGDDTQSATATLTTTANIIYGVMVSPVTDAQSGGPGEAVTYTLQVTNTGNVTDTFDVTVSDHTWPTAAPSTVGPLEAGASANVDVIVSIPTDAAGDATDTAYVIVTSQGDDTQSAIATLTTVTEAFELPSYNLFLPLIVK